jgi:hypothetical protein
MRFWTFDPNTCRFERSSKQAALRGADVAVVNDDTDVQVICDQQPPKRWVLAIISNRPTGITQY